MSKLILGFGINDSSYTVEPKKTVAYNAQGSQVFERAPRCPYYRKWTSMLRRCLSEKEKTRSPWYFEVSVSAEWHLFSNFKTWMETQDWERKQLDKDLLVPGNKVYSPHTCVFLDQRINTFIIDRKVKSDKNLPVGVSWCTTREKYVARCVNVETNKQIQLGRFDNPKLAHDVWLEYKLAQAKILAVGQKDERVSKALVYRYENYAKISDLIYGNEEA